MYCIVILDHFIVALYSQYVEPWTYHCKNCCVSRNVHINSKNISHFYLQTSMSNTNSNPIVMILGMQPHVHTNMICWFSRHWCLRMFHQWIIISLQKFSLCVVWGLWLLPFFVLGAWDWSVVSTETRQKYFRMFKISICRKLRTEIERTFWLCT